MAQYPGITLTNAGLNMIAESQASGTALIFTDLKIGDGELADGEDIKALTSVKNPMLTAPIQSYKNQGDGQVKVRFVVSNASLSIGFFARELGIYAKLGDNGAEQLYAYTNAGNLADYISDKSTPIDEQIIDIYIVVANASGVTVVTDTSVYMTKLDIQEHNTASDAHADIRKAIENSGLNILKRDKTYIVGDIAYSTNLASWMRLECVVGGKTALVEPTWGTTAGVLVVDGTVTWIIDDMRENDSVGRIVYDMFLRVGHVKANGATVNRADYPRLFKLATDNSLFNAGTFTGTTTASSTTISGISIADIAKVRVGMTISGAGITTGTTITAISATSITISVATTASGTVTITYWGATIFPGLFGIGDGSTTFVLPNLSGMFLEGGDIAGKAIAAGLPNITGQYTDTGFDTTASGSGAMYNAGGWGDRTNHGSRTGGQTSIGFNASLSNAIYGKSTTVQPPAITMIPQIKY